MRDARKEGGCHRDPLVISNPGPPEDALALIDEQLGLVLGYPLGWGGMDALEPVVLALLMVRARVADPTVSDRVLHRSYRKFLAEQVGGGAAGLRDRLGSNCSVERMVEVLREYVNSVTGSRKFDET